MRGIEGGRERDSAIARKRAREQASESEREREGERPTRAAGSSPVRPLPPQPLRRCLWCRCSRARAVPLAARPPLRPAAGSRCCSGVSCAAARPARRGRLRFLRVAAGRSSVSSGRHGLCAHAACGTRFCRAYRATHWLSRADRAASSRRAGQHRSPPAAPNPLVRPSLLAPTEAPISRPRGHARLPRSRRARPIVRCPATPARTAHRRPRGLHRPTGFSRPAQRKSNQTSCLSCQRSRCRARTC